MPLEKAWYARWNGMLQKKRSSLTGLKRSLMPRIQAPVWLHRIVQYCSNNNNPKLIVEYYVSASNLALLCCDQISLCAAMHAIIALLAVPVIALVIFQLFSSPQIRRNGEPLK